MITLSARRLRLLTTAPTFGMTVVLTLGSYAHASEHSVPCTTLPSSVQQSGKAFIENGTTLHGCVKDLSNGHTTYEMELLTANGSKDITFSPTGKVLEIEEQVHRASLPPAVASAIDKAANGGKIGKIESLTRGGKLIGFETTVAGGGTHRELAFHPDGTAMKAD